jgi:hypothetical protein
VPSLKPSNENVQSILNNIKYLKEKIVEHDDVNADV